MAITKEDVLEYISGLTVLELSELVKEFEDKFGVSPMPVAAVTAGAQPAAGEEKKEEKKLKLFQIPNTSKKQIL